MGQSCVKYRMSSSTTWSLRVGDADRIRGDAAELVALCVLPATRPEGREVRALVGPRIVIETRPRPALGRLLLPARLSGVSIHCRLALGGHGGFGAGIRRRGVRYRRLDHGRLDIDHATRPAEIVGPSARRPDSFIRAQPNGRPRTFAGSSEQYLLRTDIRACERQHRAGHRPDRSTGFAFPPRVLRLGGYWQSHRNSLTAKAALDFALDVMGKLTSAELRKIDAIARP